MPLRVPASAGGDVRLSGIPPTCMPCEAIRAFRAFAAPVVRPADPPPGARRRSTFEADAPLSRLLGQDADEQAMQAWHARGHPGADLSFADLHGEGRSAHSVQVSEPMRRVHYRDRSWGANAWPSLPLLACPVCWRLNLQRQRKPGDWRSPICSHGLGDPLVSVYAPSFTVLGPWQLPALLGRLDAAAEANRHA